LVKKETAFIKQILDVNGLPVILRVLDKRTSAGKYCVALIKSMVVDRKYDSQVRQMLAGREQILQDRSKLPQPEWISVLALTPAVQALYIEPVEADARAQQVASLQRASTSTQIHVPVAAPAAAAPSKITPLQRATTQPATIARHSTPPPQTAQPTAQTSAKPTPVPPSKPAELRPPSAQLPEAVPDTSAPVPPVPLDAPPPPPPAAVAPVKRPASSAGRGALLDSIVAGTKLKHVKPPTEEERREKRNTVQPSSGGGDNLMSALAGALAQRRTAMITDLAANPFADDKDDDDSEEWE